MAPRAPMSPGDPGGSGGTVTSDQETAVNFMRGLISDYKAGGVGRVLDDNTDAETGVKSTADKVRMCMAQLLKELNLDAAAIGAAADDFSEWDKRAGQ